MKAFANLYTLLDRTTSSNDKLSAMVAYFKQASPNDAAWAVYFLAGGKPRQIVTTKLLRQLAINASQLPEWLFEESYHAVGDLAETITLILPKPEVVLDNTEGLAIWIEEKLLPLRGLPTENLIPNLLNFLFQLNKESQFVCIKLITGNLRVGVSKLLVTRALGIFAEVDAKRVAQRLVGYTSISVKPIADLYQRLIAPVTTDSLDERDAGQPYPFFLAHPLQIDLDGFQTQLGEPSNWQIEWKWDGIRAQLVKRDGQLWIWSRGEELVTDRFPELVGLSEFLPDGTVLDGEIVILLEGKIQPFSLLQQRLGRKSTNAQLLKKAPVAMIVYDLLETQGQDLRQIRQDERRVLLETLVKKCNQSQLIISSVLQGETWEDFATQRVESRSLGVEGLMLKSKNSQYGVGRTRDVGLWWKWKIDPYTVDAVLIYAQSGHGRRSSLYSDFTFAVWDGPVDTSDRKLVPFAKAYSGLTDIEMKRVDAIVRKTTVEKFGPVRSVIPTMVFELGFEGISLSSRHKSGIAVRFPRMLRWREDKPLKEADTLQSLHALLPTSKTVEQ